MNYQSIRAKIEAPLIAAYNNQVPSIPVYVDNVTAVPPDAPKEYVRINLTFGLTTQPVLTTSLDRARGALIIRCFAAKNGGPARVQELVSIAASVLETINSSPNDATTTYVRTGELNGPDFFESDISEHFMARIQTSWQASVK